jgi:hypothetical protein
MGQYWIPVNLDKKEYIDPHKLGAGLKLWEQLANTPGTAGALIVLCAAMPERRGGGDFKESPTVGRWAGDRIALVGDYAEDGDLPLEFNASSIYEQCKDGGTYTDISDAVCAVLENEIGGKFTGSGWRHFERR